MAYLLDVIVPQWNKASWTAHLVASIKQHAPDGTRIVLVDNGSKADELEMALGSIGDYPCRLIENHENLGFIRGTNIGLCASDAEYVVLQNNDTVIFQGTYQRMLANLKKSQDVGVIGPLCSEGESWQSINNAFRLLDTQVTFSKNRSELLPHELAEELVKQFDGKRREVNGMVAFFCAMFPRKVIDKVGLLSIEYGLGFGDDDDYCERLRRAGYKILVALDSYVYHAQRTTFKANFSNEEIEKMKKENLAKFKKKWNK